LRRMESEDKIAEILLSFVPSERAKNLSALLKAYYIDLTELEVKQENLKTQKSKIELLIRLTEDEKSRAGELLFRAATEREESQWDAHIDAKIDEARERDCVMHVPRWVPKNQPKPQIGQIWTWVWTKQDGGCDETMLLIAKDVNGDFEYKTLLGEDEFQAGSYGKAVEGWIYDPEAKGADYWRDVIKNETS